MQNNVFRGTSQTLIMMETLHNILCHSRLIMTTLYWCVHVHVHCGLAASYRGILHSSPRPAPPTLPFALYIRLGGRSVSALLNELASYPSILKQSHQDMDCRVSVIELLLGIIIVISHLPRAKGEAFSNTGVYLNGK